MTENVGDKEGFGYDFFINIKTKGKKNAQKDIHDVQKDINASTKITDKRLQDELKQFEYLQRAAAEGGITGKRRKGSPEAMVNSGDVREMRDQTNRKTMRGMSKEDITAWGKMRKGLDDLESSTRKYWKTTKRNEKGMISRTRILGRLRMARMKYNRIMEKGAQIMDKAGKSSRKLTGWLTSMPMKIAAAITAWLGFKSVKEIISSVVEEGHKLEEVTHQMQLFMGGHKEAAKAIEFAQKKVMEGKGAWDYSDVMSGFKSLQEVGVDSMKYYDTIANMAGKTGNSFSSAAEAVNSAIHGNEQALEQFGIQNIHLRRFTAAFRQNTPEMRKAIMGYLGQQKMWAHGAEEMADTLDGYKARFKAYRTDLKQAIVGKPNDPNSLMGMIKGTYSKVVVWMGKNQKKLHAMAQAIGEVFKWAWKQIDHIVDRITAKVNKMDVEAFRQKIMRFVLWLELTKNKVIRFFQDYGKQIKLAAKILGAIWIFGKIQPVISGILRLNKALGGTAGSLGKIGKVAKVLGPLIAGIASGLAAIHGMEKMREKGYTTGTGALDFKSLARNKTKQARKAIFGETDKEKELREGLTPEKRRTAEELGIGKDRSFEPPPGLPYKELNYSGPQELNKKTIETLMKEFYGEGNKPYQMNMGGVTFQFNVGGDAELDSHTAEQFAEMIQSELEKLQITNAHKAGEH